MNEYNVINSPKIKGSDWNANEGEAGFIKNRTHYDIWQELSEKEVFAVPDDYDLEQNTVYVNHSPNFKLMQELLEYINPDILSPTFEAQREILHLLTNEIKVGVNGAEYSFCLYFFLTQSGAITLFFLPDESYDNKTQAQFTPPNEYIIFGDPMSRMFQYIGIKALKNGENEIIISVPGVKKLDPKYLPEMKSLSNIKDAENGGIIEGLVNGEQGQVNVASGMYAHVEGGSKTELPNGVIIYDINTASGDSSHAEGGRTTASGAHSHAEGQGTKASGDMSHAEGGSTTASGQYSHAEGSGTTASGQGSHAEGQGTTASTQGSHAEGAGTKASGKNSHAEGVGTKASGNPSHAEGANTTASGSCSHAEGNFTVANHQSQHVFGECNIEDPSTTNATDRGNYVEIVGNGKLSARSNARTLDWSGNEWLAGTMRAENGFILKSPDGSLFTLTVANDGTLTATKNV